MGMSYLRGFRRPLSLPGGHTLNCYGISGKRKGTRMKLRSAIYFLVLTGLAFGQSSKDWTFAVSGDSRNCGDVVMPEIAAGVLADKAQFYWHLGDFRAIYDFDQDILVDANGAPRKFSVNGYLDAAWPDAASWARLPRTPSQSGLYHQ